MAGWNFADAWEVVARKVPDAQCQVQGERRVTWREFDRRANGVARLLLDRGVQEQAVPAAVAGEMIHATIIRPETS